jgi:hypothetical protein
LHADLSNEVPLPCTLEYNGFKPEDLNLDVTRVPGIAKFFGESEGTRKYTLGDVVTRLDELYGCKSTIGWDFMHIQDVERCDWIRDKIERPGASFPFVLPASLWPGASFPFVLPASLWPGASFPFVLSASLWPGASFPFVLPASLV